ncbi:MAG TPA: lipopolysaccharide biosynthesis protein [Geobacter sp.]|nr:lipopolysaccharide biosynthesis protein [Geobacter sp.]
MLESLGVIAKYKKMILLVTCAAGLITVAYSLSLDKSYSSTAKILPHQQSQNLLSAITGQMGGGGVGLAGGLLGAASTSDLFAEMLKSDDIKDAIVTRFKLMQVYEKELRQDAYSQLMKNVSIQTGKEGIISITVEDRLPQRAADMANALVDEVDKLSAKVNMAQAGQSREFLENRLTRARSDLADAEEKLKAFQARNKALNVPEQARAAIEGVAQLMAQLASQEVQLASLQRQFTDWNPEVKNAKAAIANLKGQIARMEGQGGGSIPSVGSVPPLGQEYVRLMREFKTQENIVSLLVNQYELAKLSEANNVSTLQVVQAARVPERKSKPKRAQMVLVVACASFLLSVIAAFVRERFAVMPAEEREKWRRVWHDLKPFSAAQKAE